MGLTELQEPFKSRVPLAGHRTGSQASQAQESFDMLLLLTWKMEGPCGQELVVSRRQEQPLACTQQVNGNFSLTTSRNQILLTTCVSLEADFFFLEPPADNSVQPKP